MIEVSLYRLGSYWVALLVLGLPLLGWAMSMDPPKRGPAPCQATHMAEAIRVGLTGACAPDVGGPQLHDR
ncbi:MAG TPA: hypothetical protein VD973_09075 [Symbiobacteriaceae bacterium]|nr:hypothetical protein [Symbiobacteriaceae bacterium]